MDLKISNDLRDCIRNIFQPVGSIYISKNNVNPGTFIGGTWVAVTGDYILNFITSGTGGAYSGTSNTVTNSTTPGSTGSTAITIDQMPNHRHYGGCMNGWDWGSGGDRYQISGGYGYSLTGDMTLVGGGQGHTHTSAAHTHPITMKKLNMFGWIRTA